MLFNSFQFMVFFPVVTAIYFAMPHRHRWALLLGASYWFYMAWAPIYGVLLVLSTAWDWYVARRIEDTPDPVAKKRWLTLSIVVSLLVLGTFKYFNMFNETVRGAVDGMGGHWPIAPSHLVLPVGLSFYTLQAMSYVIDVYRGKMKAERNFFFFALFVSFFPQLVAGPIERAPALLPQFHEKHPFDADRLVSGIRLMAWGMFKKVVIADNLAPVVAAVFTAPQEFAGPALLIGMLCFMIQIYGDFSGYSDIAVGSARILGYDLMKNFDQPYLSPSVSELWNRWHISLSTWFRDYLYIPLGGSRVSTGRRYFNLVLMFTVSGLWHGADWHFVAWGLVWGIVVVLDQVTRPGRDALAGIVGLDGAPGLRRVLGIATTASIFFILLPFFCAKSMTDVVYVYAHLPTGGHLLTPRAIGAFFGKIQVDGALVLLVLMLYPLVEVVEWCRRHARWSDWWARETPLGVRWGADWALVATTLLLGRFEDTQFIYFQF